MDPESFQKRLSQISTVWPLVAQAHGGDTAAEAAAQTALVERYQSAVYRYLLAAVRDVDGADELFQELARAGGGDFGAPTPGGAAFAITSNRPSSTWSSITKKTTAAAGAGPRRCGAGRPGRASNLMPTRSSWRTGAKRAPWTGPGRPWPPPRIPRKLRITRPCASAASTPK